MKASIMVHIFLALTLLITPVPLCTTGTENSGDNLSRRALHEPLFPADPPPSPTQPFPSAPIQPGPPFFSPGQPQSPTQTQTISVPTNVSDHSRTQNESVKSGGKIFIGVSITIVAVVLVLASACFIHRRRNWNSSESEKLVGGGGAIRQQNASGDHNHQIPAMGAPAGTSFLYIGTVDPSRGRVDEMKSSPYHRLSESNNRIDYHRASPELQPIPPLAELGEQRPPQAGTMTSDDEESYHTAEASVAGRNFSPHRLALQQSIGNSTTTNATSTTRSSTSTKCSTNTTASFGKAGRTSPEVRSPAVESSSPAVRLTTAPSPQLQPMIVLKQLRNSQSDWRTSFRSIVSPPASLPALPPMQPFQTKVGSSPASPPLTPMETFQIKKTQKDDPPLSPPPPPPPPPPMQAFQTKRRIQSLLMPRIPRPTVQSLRTRMTQKVQESPSSSPPSDQSSQAKAVAETQSRPAPPPPPPLPPPPHPPPPPPPPSHEPSSPRRPSSSVQLQHPILNKNRLPEPCPPLMAACPQTRAEILESNIPKELCEEAENDNLKPRLKPLHWDKVRANSDREMVWDRLKSSSFKLNEDMIETLFVCNPANDSEKKVVKKPALHAVPKETRVLDPKKSQNIAILLRALNVTKEEVCQALLDGNPEGLGSELLETIVKMAPTKQEEIQLKEYRGDISKLGPAERFLKDILDIPFAFKRIEALLYMVNFEGEVKYLRKSFETLEVACEELRSSQLFLRLLEAVLRAGNRMNVGTKRGDAEAFKLETLLKLVDIKGIDGKTTLLHFVVQEIVRSEGQGICSNKEDQHHENVVNNTYSNLTEISFKKQGLRVVSGLSSELTNVKKAASMDSEVLRNYLTKLSLGLEKINSALRQEGIQGTKLNDNIQFSESTKQFHDKAEAEILRVKAEESVALSLVKEITEYFQGDTEKEEAHPFRIFMIVRDFLSILDKVCKEVGKIQERSIMSSARSFGMPLTASLPTFPRYTKREDNSDDESLSP